MIAIASTPRRSSPRWFQVARFHRKALPGTSSALCVPGAIVDARIAGHERTEVRRGDQDQFAHQRGGRRQVCLVGLQSGKIGPGDQPAHAEAHQVDLRHLRPIVDT